MTLTSHLHIEPRLINHVNCTPLHVSLCKHRDNIFLAGDQLDAKFLVRHVYLNPLHVSSNSVLILRKTIVLIQLLVSSLCVSGRPVCRVPY